MTIYSKFSASITELKKSLSQLIEEAGSEPIAILNHNRPSAYLIPSHTFEKMMEIIEDQILAKEVERRLEDGESPVKVSLDEL